MIEVGDTPSKPGAVASGQMLIAASKASIVKTEDSGKGSPLVNGKHYSNMQIKIDQVNWLIS